MLGVGGVASCRASLSSTTVAITWPALTALPSSTRVARRCRRCGRAPARCRGFRPGRRPPSFRSIVVGVSDEVSPAAARERTPSTNSRTSQAIGRAAELQEDRRRRGPARCAGLIFEPGRGPSAGTACPGLTPSSLKHHCAGQNPVNGREQVRPDEGGQQEDRARRLAAERQRQQDMKPCEGQLRAIESHDLLLQWLV